MEEEKISFETAKLAKEKHFNIRTRTYFDKKEIKEISKLTSHNDSSNRISRPTQSLLQKWLREGHNIDVEAQKDYGFYTAVIYLPGRYKPSHQWKQEFGSYEEALEIGLQEALKLI